MSARMDHAGSLERLRGARTLLLKGVESKRLEKKGSPRLEKGSHLMG